MLWHDWRCKVISLWRSFVSVSVKMGPSQMIIFTWITSKHYQRHYDDSHVSCLRRTSRQNCLIICHQKIKLICASLIFIRILFICYIYWVKQTNYLQPELLLRTIFRWVNIINCNKTDFLKCHRSMLPVVNYTFNHQIHTRY